MQTLLADLKVYPGSSVSKPLSTSQVPVGVDLSANALGKQPFISCTAGPRGTLVSSRSQVFGSGNYALVKLPESHIRIPCLSPVSAPNSSLLWMQTLRDDPRDWVTATHVGDLESPPGYQAIVSIGVMNQKMRVLIRIFL